MCRRGGGLADAISRPNFRPHCRIVSYITEMPRADRSVRSVYLRTIAPAADLGLAQSMPSGAIHTNSTCNMPLITSGCEPV